MKKILTVSLFAMMAVSAANAEIASTDYVGKQLQPYSTTAQMQSYVSGELAVVNGNNTALSGRVDTLESVVTAEGGVQDAVEAIEKALADDGETGKAIADNAAAIEAMDTAYKAADKAITDSIGTVETGKTVVQMINEASAGAGTALTTALQDYSTTAQMNSAIASADTALETKVTNAYEAADTALETSLKSYADTAEADAIAAAKTETTTQVNALATGAVKTNTDNIAAMDTAYKAADKAITDSIGTVETGKTVVQMINEASAGAGTALTTALQDYSTTAQMNSAIASADTALETKVTNAYEAADTALETSLKSYADTAEADAIAAAKTAGDAAYDSKGSAAAAVNAAKTAADATYQVKSSALSVGAADGAWTDLTKADGYSTTGTHSLVLKNGTIQWEAVSY